MTYLVFYANKAYFYDFSRANTSISNNMMVINIINQDTIWRQEVFFFNNHLFRWETYRAEMEFVYFRYSRLVYQYTNNNYSIESRFENFIEFNYGKYERNEIQSNDTILGKYSILDSSNKHIGNMEIRKCE